MSLLRIFLLAGFITLENAARRCYSCNSANDQQCDSSKAVKGSRLYTKCNSIQDFIKYDPSRNNSYHGNERPGSSDFLLEPHWTTAAEEYVPICKKIVMKLSSRDPPGTIVEFQKALSDIRPAMPLRHFRYCGIQSKAELARRPDGCVSRFGSAKMEVGVCWCSGDLCNIGEKPSIATELLAVEVLINGLMVKICGSSGLG